MAVTGTSVRIAPLPPIFFVEKKEMNRRDFLKMLGLGGLGVVAEAINSKLPQSSGGGDKPPELEIKTVDISNSEKTVEIISEPERYWEKPKSQEEINWQMGNVISSGSATYYTFPAFGSVINLEENVPFNGKLWKVD